MIVPLAAETETDLEAIGDFIAEVDPVRARKILQDLRACCLELAELAHAFPLVPRYQHYGLRRRVHGTHLIFYKIAGESVIVIHVLHGAMDYEPILFG
ncbi:type II toxin-antitoxin system RelE/ParE family toxin [Lichenifustis flavocetrariae]|uniref:Type II toxin-antitoxin system RelE/ParE family toxin n=1 Tax=Lichenifustis flavocetrariae TaxID=2949735 RepID=A0AA42CL10_9HYPH|nr:type II toxin-antitoxin system RelE/ParE family toxin [Lichenifustis flavocetrariae]MCW6511134.1 type II toxin-antitoxin system RelE/ParE family toxin [Lichenifustis flavocetrariae]